jgi:ADP-ribose pyrophosphatase YjhB (NUDIX family)
MFEGKFIIASGPVIIKEGRLLINKDNKDDFYKIPGGTIEPNTENLEEAFKREVKEETNADIKIIKPLNPMAIWKNPTTEEKMAILLIHYKAELLKPEEIKPCEETKEIKWLNIEEIKQGKHNVAPNIKFLIEKGDIQ